MTGQEADYNRRHAAYDPQETPRQAVDYQAETLTSLRGLRLQYARVSALYVLREQVIRPVLAGVRTIRQHPHPVRTPALDQHYERLRLDLQPVFQKLGIAA
jgi:hypothetical protein